MGKFVVLKKQGKMPGRKSQDSPDQWFVIGRTQAAGRLAAINKLASGAGKYVALSEGLFAPVPVESIISYRVKEDEETPPSRRRKTS